MRAVDLALVLLIALGPTVAFAQTDDPAAAPVDTTAAATTDTTATGAPSLTDLGKLSEAASDSLRAVTDSLAATADTTGVSGTTGTAKPPAPWWDALRPSVTVGVDANVSQRTIRGSLNAPVFRAIGSEGSIDARASRTSYRQFDRDQEDTSLRGDLSQDLGESIALKVDFSRQTNFDENRPANIDPIVLDYRAQDARVALNGNHPLAVGFSHHWAVRTRVEDVNQTNRNVRNDRSLATAGLTSVWKRTGDVFDLSGRYGYERSSGERLVRGVTDDATVEVDTLATKFELYAVPRTQISVDALRATFFEERLDFARNANGVVDTLNVVDPVGREREVREGYDVGLSFDTRLLPWIRLDGRAGRDFSETVYRFSRQGVVQRGSESLSGGATWSYADAGSLQASIDYSDRFNDRRAQGNVRFRGEESTRSYSADARLRQALFAQSDLSLQVGQTLTQSIFEETGNNNDRDRLVDEAVAEIGTGALPYTDVTVRGLVRNTSEINIAADRVGNNKDELLYEVRTSYTFDPPGGFSARQTYRLQIVFRDFVDGLDRDSFNKQGQVTTNVDWNFSGGGRLGVEYLSDFRSTGARDVRFPIRELYVTESVRNDRRLSVRVDVPIRALNLSASTERGFLDQDTRGRITEEERGKINLRASGQWSFFRDQVTLDLDVERVLQFGPRVRPEQEDYWVANSSLRIDF